MSNIGKTKSQFHTMIPINGTKNNKKCARCGVIKKSFEWKPGQWRREYTLDGVNPIGTNYDCK